MPLTVLKCVNRVSRLSRNCLDQYFGLGADLGPDHPLSILSSLAELLGSCLKDNHRHVSFNTFDHMSISYHYTYMSQHTSISQSSSYSQSYQVHIIPHINLILSFVSSWSYQFPYLSTCITIHISRYVSSSTIH